MSKFEPGDIVKDCYYSKKRFYLIIEVQSDIVFPVGNYYKSFNFTTGSVGDYLPILENDELYQKVEILELFKD